MTGHDSRPHHRASPAPARPLTKEEIAAAAAEKFRLQQHDNAEILAQAVAQMHGSPQDRVEAVLKTGIMMSLNLDYDVKGLTRWLRQQMKAVPDAKEIADFFAGLNRR